MLSNNSVSVQDVFKREGPKEEDAFIPFQPAHLQVSPSLKNEQILESGDTAFSIKSGFWESLLNDAWIKRELDRVVEERVVERAKVEVADAVNRGLEEGNRRGFEEGQLRAKQECEMELESLKLSYSKSMAGLLNRMNEISIEFIGQKKALLEQHSIAWGRALCAILSNIPMAPVLGWDEKLNHWLSAKLEVFRSIDKVTLFFSSEEFERLQQADGDLSKYPWTLSRDESLAEGEVRVECGDGGVFFSKKECERTIMDLVKQLQPEGIFLK